MILSFSRDSFATDILIGKKKHTIRADKGNRWKAGRTIHFWRGNPRNVNGKNKPYQFATGLASKVERIQITFPTEYLNDAVIKVDGRALTLDEQVELAHNDGFEHLIEMLLFFKEDFSGNLIHFSEVKPIENV